MRLPVRHRDIRQCFPFWGAQAGAEPRTGCGSFGRSAQPLPAALNELSPAFRTLTYATICCLLIFDEEEIRDVETEEPFAEFKAKVALEALKGERTVAVLAPNLAFTQR